MRFGLFRFRDRPEFGRAWEGVKMQVFPRRALLGVMMFWWLSGLVAPAAAQTRVEQSGTVGLTLSGSWAVITGDSRYGNGFDNGPGLTFGLRYVLGSHWSMGLSFYSQTYDAKPDTTGLTKLRMTNVIFDTYFYRDRNTDASQYLSLGIGFYRPELHRASDVAFPGENFLVSLGLGAEIFIRENWGVELSGRAFGYVGEGVTPQETATGTAEATGNFSLGIQGQVGIIYYLLK